MTMPRKVYLDTNMWIDLERAQSEEENPYTRTLEHVRRRVEEGRICLPLSIAHCLEMVKHSDVGKRRRLWNFATNLSGCLGILNKQAVLPPLIEEAVYKVFGAELNRRPTEVFTGSGLFGVPFKEQIPRTKLVTTEYDWNHFWLDMPDEIHQQLFDGLRVFEDEFVRRRSKLKEEFRGESCVRRKRAYVARLLLDLQHSYGRSLARLGRTTADVESLSMEDRIRLVTEVPPLDVEVSLAIQHQQQWDRQEVGNDVRDISHLCMAVPYCDVVFTERYWVDKIQREKLDKKYGTQVTSDLAFLLQI